MVWVVGNNMPKWHRNNDFIHDLAKSLVEIHTRESQNEPETNMFKIADGLDTTDPFVKEAVRHFNIIREDLVKSAVLHGDLWNENIIIKENGRLSGLIDWEHTQIGDPHWDFRMIRRFIGWDGLHYLISLYNEKSQYKLHSGSIYILDKLALCHQYQYRQRKNDSRTSLFKEYIDRWPVCINDLSN